MDPAAELMNLAVLIASWLSHCEDTNTMFGTVSLIHMRSDVLLVSVRDYFPNNKTNNNALFFYVADLENGHNHLCAAAFTRYQLRGSV